MTLPRAVRPFVDFATLLRKHGFSVSPDQTESFIAAIDLLGPKDLEDIRRAARAMFAIPHEREPEFEALFRALFMGQTLAAPVTGGDDEDEVKAHEPTGGEAEAMKGDDAPDAGIEATTAERLKQRIFSEGQDFDALRRFARLAPAQLPRRQSYRQMPAPHGHCIDMRKTLREAVRRDGEIFTLARLRRKTRQRRIVLLIDVSGSMQQRNEPALRFAHTLKQAADHMEAFTLGTRLTRITPALSARFPDQALMRISQLVADFDGGTRLGEALQAFLAVPRFASFARGSLVLVLSDGLERGSPNSMIDAVWRLSRMAWRLEWLTPLADDQDYRPETAALAAVLPYLDSLSDGSRMDHICDHVLTIARAA